MERLCFLSDKRICTKIAFNKRAVEQINGREGETATFLKRFFFTLSLRVAGFAPRHLNR